MTETKSPPKLCIIVHGGAGDVPLSDRDKCLCAVKEAVQIGYEALSEGRCALDAVEEATRSMENSGILNAGCGSYLTEEGTVECDAMIMDGHTLNYGAVTCVQNISNPISLARKVMTDTPHCMLAGEGALKFARRIGFPVVQDAKVLISDRSYQAYLNKKGKQDKHTIGNCKKDATGSENIAVKNNSAFLETKDTVGSVAMDASGHIAVSCSTGGTPYKMCGRAGDSPLVGSGSYANLWGGAVCTGHGESIMKVVLSREVVHCIEKGDTPAGACMKSLSKMTELTGKLRVAGVISLDKFGEFGVAFNTRQMMWASVANGVMQYGIEPGEKLEEPFYTGKTVNS